MTDNPPRLRDGDRRRREPFPLNEIPEDVVQGVARHLTFLLAIGRKDVDGNDWGDALAEAIGGGHLAKPLGIADVHVNGMAWSTKTVKVLGAGGPHQAKSLRLISGRNSPDYSHGITDPHLDIAATGRAVLSIWNERLKIALDSYWPVRISVLVRSQDLLSYSLFEEPAEPFDLDQYEWSYNKNGNLVAKDLATGENRFTWQFHGSQFTIHLEIPDDAVRFQITRPRLLVRDEILRAMDYSASWVSILRD